MLMVAKLYAGAANSVFGASVTLSLHIVVVVVVSFPYASYRIVCVRQTQDLNSLNISVHDCFARGVSRASCMYCSPLYTGYTGSFAALASHNEVINSHSLNGANATENKTLLRALAYPGGTGVDGRFRRIHREQKPQSRRRGDRKELLLQSQQPSVVDVTCTLSSIQP